MILLALASTALSGCTGGFSEPYVAPRTAGDPSFSPSYMALLWDNPFPRLVVEVDYVEGRPPSPIALSALEETLRDVTGKQEITILQPTAIAPVGGSCQSRLGMFHETHFDSGLPGRSGNPETGVAWLHVMILAGVDCGGAAGVFQDGMSAVFVFPDSFDDMIPLPQEVPDEVGLPNAGAAQVERAVLIHEVGHALGLVNIGIPMVNPHEDPEHPGHSSNEGSVMYWAVDSTAGLMELIENDNENVPYKFDADDLADLQSYRDSQGG